MAAKKSTSSTVTLTRAIPGEMIGRTPGTRVEAGTKLDDMTADQAKAVKAAGASK